MVYEYLCNVCGNYFSQALSVEYRYLPTTLPCLKCGEYEVTKVISRSNIKVNEGGCGNAANGYSSTHGDSENFKAGRKVYK